MPYEPERRQRLPSKPNLRQRNQARSNVVALAAILSLVVAFFNLYVALPTGVPPEFPLFLSLAAIFGALWWTIRKTVDRRR
jgi:hypothetical protein